MNNPVDNNKRRQVVRLDDSVGRSQASNVPFIFEMVTCFLKTACRSVDPILHKLGGYEDLGTDDDGLPLAPDSFNKKFGQLSINELFNYVGSSIHATTNLGLAYSHSIHLLVLLTSQTTKPYTSMKSSGSPPKRISLVSEYDKLSKQIRRDLININEQVKLHDFDVEVTTGKFENNNGKRKYSGNDRFRDHLEYWNEYRLLQDSHMLFSHPHSSIVRFMVPLRSILVLDRIIANLIAPKIGVNYRVMNEQLSKMTKSPKLDWDGEKVSATLPDKMDDWVEAQWTPSVTSVIRIRQSGTQEWSPGFETIFGHCSFIDLKPDTEYEMQVTHKNDAGESEPKVITVRTDPET